MDLTTIINEQIAATTPRQLRRWLADAFGPSTSTWSDLYVQARALEEITIGVEEDGWKARDVIGIFRDMRAGA